MKYHPASDTIVAPFNEHRYDAAELFPLTVSDYPAMSGGDTIVAKTPYLDGGAYRMDYWLLPKDSAAQAEYMKSRDISAAVALL